MSGEEQRGRDLRVRWRVVGAAALASGTISAIALRWLDVRGSGLPYTPLLLAALLLLVGAVALGIGLRLRRWVRRGDDVDGLGAARTLALGQTVALGGGILAGYLAARLGMSLGYLHAVDQRAQALAAGLSLAAAAAMTVAGMVTQWCCLVPPEDDHPDDDGMLRP